MLLQGKTVLITGAARGIGQCAADVLASAGADLALADVRPEAEETAARLRDRGRRAAAATFDVSDPSQVRDGVHQLRERVGEIDVLVSNAGIVSNIAPLDMMTHSAWEREVAVNLTGAFNMIQIVIGPMARRGWGRIIVVSSVAAHGGLHHQAAYAASKAGLLGLVHTVALEHARHGVTCNAILPGLIETETVLTMPPEIREATRTRTPARRLGTMEEVAHLIAFLASDHAGFINGAEIAVDGGLRLNTLPLASRRELQEQRWSG